MPSSGLRVGGFVPFSSVDWPGVLCAVVFCQGCPWECRYCHNPHLRPFTGEGELTWGGILELLRDRAGFLEGVVFSGGEATCRPELPEALAEVRALGYRTALHTSGSCPERLRPLLPLLDWVGLDIKAPLDGRHDRITGVAGLADKVRESLGLLLASGLPHQLRTTVHPRLLSPEDLSDLQAELAALGAGPSLIQPFRPQGCEDEELPRS
jgi:pyruvate formate lyase activating enzyme